MEKFTETRREGADQSPSGEANRERDSCQNKLQPRRRCFGTHHRPPGTSRNKIPASVASSIKSKIYVKTLNSSPGMPSARCFPPDKYVRLRIFPKHGHSTIPRREI